MANYFNFFPATFYNTSDTGTTLDIVTNIIARYNFNPSLKKNTSIFYPYKIKDSDTPESIAHKLYGSPERHWIVLMFNDIIDPQYDWPMTYSIFNDFVDKKYAANGAANTTPQSGLSWAKSENNIHSYYKITTRTPIKLDIENKTITERIQVTEQEYATIQVGITEYTFSSNVGTYDATIVSNTTESLAPVTTSIRETVSKEKLTYYEYEMQQNEKKRDIKLLNSQYVPDIIKEFKAFIKR